MVAGVIRGEVEVDEFSGEESSERDESEESEDSEEGE